LKNSGTVKNVNNDREEKEHLAPEDDLSSLGNLVGSPGSQKVHKTYVLETKLDQQKSNGFKENITLFML